MINNEKNNLEIDKLYTIFRGCIPPTLNPEEDISNYELIKLAGIKNIKEWLETENLDCINDNYLNYKMKLKKEYGNIRKNDIVLPLVISSNSFEPIIIDMQPKETIYYNTTILVIRAPNELLSKYLYIKLHSQKVKDQLISKTSFAGKYQKRLTKDIISHLEIPLDSKNEINRLVKEFNDIQDMKNKLKIQEKEFWNKIN